MKNIYSQLSNAATINLQHFSPLFLHIHAFPRCQCKDSRMGLRMGSVVQAWEVEGPSKDSGSVKATRWRTLFLVLDVANENLKSASTQSKTNKNIPKEGTSVTQTNKVITLTSQNQPRQLSFWPLPPICTQHFYTVPFFKSKGSVCMEDFAV